MGADMIAVAVGWRGEPDWQAAEHAIETASIERLVTGLENAGWDPPADIYDDDLRVRPQREVAIRDGVRGVVRRAQRELDGTAAARSEVCEVTFDGVTVAFSGGLSWGDDPTEAYRALSDLWEFPEIMRAAGFIFDGSPATHDALENAVRHARLASEGDSNDDEIEALQAALDEALLLLNRNDLLL